MNATGFGFDHVVVAVRDLPAAQRRFEDLGFDVELGGRHPGFGTANALVTFDNGYLELLAVEDAAVARQAGVRRREVVDYLEQREGGLIGYAIRCDRLDDVGRGGDGAGPGLSGPPLEMSRVRPDGSTIRWRLLVPGGSTWCRPWPFVIEWDPANRPPGAETRTSHPNGASAVDGIVVAARSPAQVESFYRKVLGLAVRPLPASETPTAARSVVEVGGCRVELAEVAGPATPGPINGTLDGEGPVELRVRVRNLEAVAQRLADRGISAAPHGAHRLDVQPEDAAGARLAFIM